MSLNKVMIIGRLGQKPEGKTLDNGNQVANFSVATSETWNDKNGQKQERTEWHSVTARGKLAEICLKYLDKGRQVYVEGKLQTRSWEDNGTKRYKTDVIASTVQFLGSNSGGNSGAQPGDPGPVPPQGGSFTEDEIPF